MGYNLYIGYHSTAAKAHSITKPVDNKKRYLKAYRKEVKGQ
ncbi:MAG: hypothetical protein ACI8WT_002182 [Clostridium sp.]|jgi:hypothetical protein